MILITDIDPKLEKALCMIQFSAQYLASCQNSLGGRRKLLLNALKVISDEEDELDLQLAKLRYFANIQTTISVTDAPSEPFIRRCFTSFKM